MEFIIDGKTPIELKAELKAERLMRLTAEEQRLAAEEQRLAAEEQRREEMEKRLAADREIQELKAQLEKLRNDQT